jgi:hypothetical protein
MTRNTALEMLSPRLSRRRLLAATAAATAMAPIRGPWTTLARSSAMKQAAPTGPWPDATAIPAKLAADASPRFRAVADAVRDAMVEHGIPGTALGILMDGEEEHAVFGLANLETNEPVTPETRFQIGSVGKTYTGTAIMQMIAAGKLDLYAPVRTYLPDFELQDESVAARLTVYHLLTTPEAGGEMPSSTPATATTPSAALSRSGCRACRSWLPSACSRATTTRGSSCSAACSKQSRARRTARPSKATYSIHWGWNPPPLTWPRSNAARTRSATTVAQTARCCNRPFTCRATSSRRGVTFGRPLPSSSASPASTSPME